MKLRLPLLFRAAVLTACVSLVATVHADESFEIPGGITWAEATANKGNNTESLVPDLTNWHVTGTSNGTSDSIEWIQRINGKNSDYLHIESGNFRYKSATSTEKYFEAIIGAKIGTVIGKANDETSGPVFYGSVAGATVVNSTTNPWLRIESGLFNNKIGAAYKDGDKANPGTVYLMINGGTFKNDVAGVLSSDTNGATTCYYGNTDITINGGKFTSAYGIYGGTSSGNALHQAMAGNATLTIQGSTTSIMFAVGGNRITAATVGDATLTGDTIVKLINGATASGLIGGNAYLSDSKTESSLVTGNTNIFIDGGNITSTSLMKGVIGGSICGTVTGTATITIQGTSKITGAIIGGNVGWFEHSLGNSIIHILSGDIDVTGTTSYSGSPKINNQIYGGSVAISKYTSFGSDLSITGSTTVNISGAKIKGNIYGGGHAQGFYTTPDSPSATATLSILGGSNVNISGGEITGNVYGASSAGVNGTATVNSANINITGGVIIGNIYAGGSNSGAQSSSSVTELATVTISGGTVTGSFDGSTGKGEGTSHLNITNYQAVTNLPKQWNNSIQHFTQVTFGANVNIESLAREVTFTGNGTLALIDGAKFTHYAGLGDISSTSISIAGAGSSMILGQTNIDKLNTTDGGIFRLGLTGSTTTDTAILTSASAFRVSDLKIDPSTQLGDLKGKSYTLVGGAASLADGFTINGLNLGVYKKDGKMLSYTIADGKLTFGSEITDSTIMTPPDNSSSSTTTEIAVVEGKTEKSDGTITFTPDGINDPVTISTGNVQGLDNVKIAQVVVTKTTTVLDTNGDIIDQEVSSAGSQTLLSIKNSEGTETTLTGTEGSSSQITADLIHVGAGSTLNLENLTLKTNTDGMQGGKAGAAIEIANATVVLVQSHIDGANIEGEKTLSSSVNSSIHGSGSVKNMSVMNGSLRAGNSPGVLALSNIITGVSSGTYGQGNNMVLQAQICNFGGNIVLDGMNNTTDAISGNISQFNITGNVVLGSGTVFQIILWKENELTPEFDTTTLKSGAKFQFFTFNGGSITGEFAGMLDAPTLANGLMWDISQLTTGGFAQVIWSSIGDGVRIANTLWTSGQTVANISTEAMKHVGEAVTGKTTVWLSSLNDFTRANSDGMNTGYDFNTQGYSVGAQRGIEGGHVIGLAFGNSYGTHTPMQDSKHATAGKIKQDAVMGTVYGHIILSQVNATDNVWSIDAYAGYGEVSNKSTRMVKFDSSTANAKWHDMARTIGVQGNFAKKINEKTIVTPFAALDFIHGEQDNFTETSKAVDANYTNGAYYNLRASLGASISYVVAFSNGMALIPSLTASYGYDVCRMNPHTDVSEAAGDYRAYGVSPGRNSFQITPALSWKINKAWSASTNYTLRTRSGLTDQSVNASVGYTF